MHDTHTSKLLSGTSPDITLVMKSRTPSAFNAVFVVELQVRHQWGLSMSMALSW